MAARHEQQQIRKVEVGIDEARAERMAFEMVDRDQRLVRGERQPLAGEQRDHHSADQPRPGGRGDRIDLARSTVPASDSTRRIEVGKDLDMRARRDLRHHAAVRLMRGVLADHGLREDAPIARHQRHRAVVAG